MNVVIAGARGRQEKRNPDDRDKVYQIICMVEREYRPNLVLYSVGCDDGIGKHVLDITQEKGILFCEFRLKTFGGNNIPRKVFMDSFEARNFSLLKLADEVHFFDGKGAALFPLVEMKQRLGDERVKLYPSL